MFGDVAFDAAADYGDWEPVREQLGALSSLISAGKVSARSAANDFADCSDWPVSSAWSRSATWA
jgi:hypothetical protein